MANYTRMQLADFQQKLQGGAYETVAGARRAAAKIEDFSASNKKKARAWIDDHFKSTEPATKAKQLRVRPPPGYVASKKRDEAQQTGSGLSLFELGCAFSALGRRNDAASLRELLVAAHAANLTIPDILKALGVNCG